MKNIFYIDYKFLDSIKNNKIPLGVIISDQDILVGKLDNLLKELFNNKEEHLIAKVIFRMKINQKLLDNLPVYENLYYQFTNEDEEGIRELIFDLKNYELKRQILGNNLCQSGVDILKYRFIGISNIMIKSPIINSSSQIEMLKKLGYTLFTIPNYLELFTEPSQNPNWIRPEGIKFYDSINDWILMAGDLNINTILNAYSHEAWLGSLSDIIVNFNSKIKNFLIPTFDIKRTTCGGNCLQCNKCNKEFFINSAFTKEEGEKI